MFRYFENLIDPYCEYTQTDTPPTRLWPFLRGYCRPFYGVLVLIALAVFYLLIRPVLFGLNILLFNQTLDANSTMLVR